MTARRATLAAGLTCALACALSAPAAWAQATPWQVEAGVGTDHLSNGRADWSQVDLALRQRWAPRSVFEINLRRTRRSGLADSELGALVALPLDTQWSASLGASASPSHRVLARQGLRAELSRTLAEGWVAHIGVGRRRFDSDGASGGNSQLSLGMERYAGPWRWAIALGQTHLDGGGSAGTLRLQFDRFFANERGRVGLIASVGRELETLPATALVAADLLDQRVNAIALTGQWPLAPAWALVGDLSITRYDDARSLRGAPTGVPYRRNGLRVGVQHDF